MSVSERRTASRFVMNLPLQLQRVKTPSPVARAVNAMNISIRSVYFATDLPLRQGEFVQVRLQIPHEISGNVANERRFNLQAAVRGLAAPSLAPNELCVRLNALLHRNMEGDRFVTFFYAQLDSPARRLSYVNAGHNPPIVVHRDGSHHRLRQGGVLGVFSDQTFASGIIQLQPGDRLVVSPTA
jgi:hypothetical protein